MLSHHVSHTPLLCYKLGNVVMSCEPEPSPMEALLLLWIPPTTKAYKIQFYLYHRPLIVLPLSRHFFCLTKPKKHTMDELGIIDEGVDWRTRLGQDIRDRVTHDM